jgi:integrase
MPKASRRRTPRAKGEGTLRQRKDSSWEFRLTVGIKNDGKPDLRTIYGRTQAIVLEKANKLKQDFHQGVLAEPDSRTLKEYGDAWLERKSRGKAASTQSNYKRELDLATKTLGSMRVQAVKPVHIRGLLDRLTKEGYAPRTVKKTLERLRAVFKDAVRLEVIHRNPAEAVDVDLPPSEPIGKTLEPEDVTKLLGVSEGHHAGLLFRLILATGLRKSEALALTWGDVDFQTAQLRISKGWVRVSNQLLLTTPKTRNSKRSVPIPPNLLARLEARREKTITALAAMKWKGKIEEVYVFGMVGEATPFVPDMPNKWLVTLSKLAGITTHYRVHDLRHTYGSLQLRMKVPLEVVSERMGHANPTITLNIYRHLLEDERRGYIHDIEDVVKTPERIPN